MSCPTFPQASPWDALLHRPPARRARPAPPDAQPGTKLSGLLQLLQERGSTTTLTLSVCADLSSRQVWGLLKHPRRCGQVRFDAGRWTLCQDFPGRDVQLAIELLRSKGYTVLKPKEQG
jgi:hypothetical protein